jgi:hypothetical protein
MSDNRGSSQYITSLHRSAAPQSARQARSLIQQRKHRVLDRVIDRSGSREHDRQDT